MTATSRSKRARFVLWRLKRAIINRLDLRTALHCALQMNRLSVRHSGIGNEPGWEEHFSSLAHFRHDIPSVLPRRSHDIRVAQSFLETDFVTESRPMVFFSREPTPLIDEETGRNMQREDLAPQLLRFDEPDIAQRQFYVALPRRRDRILRRLRKTINQQRPRLVSIVNRIKENDQLPLLSERIRFIEAMGDEIDIYGKAPEGQVNPWDRYPNYHGAARDKIRTLERYTFNLCFENCDEDGYITEKIIHAQALG